MCLMCLVSQSWPVSFCLQLQSNGHHQSAKRKCGQVSLYYCHDNSLPLVFLAHLPLLSWNNYCKLVMSCPCGGEPSDHRTRQWKLSPQTCIERKNKAPRKSPYLRNTWRMSPWDETKSLLAQICHCAVLELKVLFPLTLFNIIADYKIGSGTDVKLVRLMFIINSLNINICLRPDSIFLILFGC